MTTDDRSAMWAALRKPFPAKEIDKLPKGGTTLDYVGHAAVTSRLLEVDPLWNWEPVAWDERGLPLFVRDNTGRVAGLWIRLTIGGVTRLGYGSVAPGAFDAEKQLIGDCVARGTLISTRRGNVPVQDVRVGDEALTRVGWRRITDHWMSHPAAPVMRASFSDGTTLTGTPHHPVYVRGGDFTNLGQLRNGDIIHSWHEQQSSPPRWSSTTASPSGATRAASTTRDGMGETKFLSTERYTCGRLALSQPVGTSTISTATTITMPSPISSRCRHRLIMKHTPTMTVAWTAPVAHAAGITTPGKHGVAGAPLPVRNAHGERAVSIGWPAYAPSAGLALRWNAKPPHEHAAGSAPNLSDMPGYAAAWSAERPSWQSAGGRSTAPVVVVGLSDAGLGEVWNLTVQGQNEFYANGILTHNSIRNAAMRFGVALDLWAKSDLYHDDDDAPPPPKRGHLAQTARDLGAEPAEDRDEWANEPARTQASATPTDPAALYRRVTDLMGSERVTSAAIKAVLGEFSRDAVVDWIAAEPGRSPETLIATAKRGGGKFE